MIDQKSFGLNRIIAPEMSLKEFFAFARSVGIDQVELRNDLKNPDPIDRLPAREAARLAADSGISIVTINALQKFNLASARPRATEELKALLDKAREIGCAALVLCPNNDANDKRPAAQRQAETTEALAAFGPLFSQAGITGLVEPLGFSICSLPSLVTAQECIRASGFGCYKTVHDTFHHFIGPDDEKIFDGAYDVKNTGLVHVSGVESGIPVADYRDEHRVLVGPRDRMHNKAQLARLDSLGFAGVYSFEPFSAEVQALPRPKLADAVKKSLEFLLS